MTFTPDNERTLFEWLWPDECWHDYEFRLSFQDIKADIHKFVYVCKYCKGILSSLEDYEEYERTRPDLTNPTPSDMVEMMEAAFLKGLAIFFDKIGTEEYLCQVELKLRKHAFAETPAEFVDAGNGALDLRLLRCLLRRE